MLSLMACQIENTIEPTSNKLDGQWQLMKTTVGYPAPNSPTEIKVTNTEIIEFNTSSKTFTRSLNGKVVEKTDFEIQALAYNGSEPREAIVFPKNKNYAFITYDDNNSTIILYEKTPIGVVLADGNSYHYQKVK